MKILQSMLLVILLSLMLSQVSCQCQDDENYQEYLKWKQLFAEKFQDGQDIFRAFIYKQHKKMIKKNNQNPNSEHNEGETRFMAISKEEFVATYLGTIPPDHNTAVVELNEDEDQNKDENDDIIVNAIATSIDWRVKGGVTAVRNQGSCGSCWAFSSVAAIQSSYLIKNKVQLDLSQQQLVSCANIYGNGGCNGGWPANALKYPLNYGITTEAAYPYSAKTGTCKQTGGDFKIKRVRTSAYGKCGGLRRQVQHRAVSVALDATDWGLYKSGVFKCNPDRLSINHAVTLVGYDEKKNWIIKNSWGTGWGEKGYMKIKAGNKFNCGICKYGSDAAIV